MEYTVTVKIAEEIKEGDLVWRPEYNNWAVWRGTIPVALNKGKKFLVRVPSSPVMSKEEFFKKYRPQNDAREEPYLTKYEGYLIGTRSIVPEMTDEEIEKLATEYADTFKANMAKEMIEIDNDEYQFTKADYKNGLKVYREQIRSRINK